MSCQRVSRVRVLARVRPAFEKEESVLATSLTDSTVTVRARSVTGVVQNAKSLECITQVFVA